jgi:predicted DNA-binding protein (MmcQ/YjbR family)
VTDFVPQTDTIVFGRRDNTTYTNSINSSYVFNNKSWISLNLRHYWSQIDYDKYYKLEENGDLAPNPQYNENADFNFNVFNVDLMYSWNFAPGSYLNVVWKNSIYEDEDIKNNEFYNFLENLKNTINSNQVQNSFSIKISYYLDYKYLLKKAG